VIETDLVDGEYLPLVSTQTYGPQDNIDGVDLIDLRVSSDEGGDFCEITRFLQDGTLAVRPGYRPVQISFSLMEGGTIKAFHLHERQDDLWFVSPHTRLLIGLLDVRATSRTRGITQRFVLGAGRAQLLYIPRGVAHGVSNPTQHPATLLYLSNNGFDADHPDEHRLPFDLLGSDFWTVRPG
jgi:dTDP-4-dehydrorhamnose 3,5-epimerase